MLLASQCRLPRPASSPQASRMLQKTDDPPILPASLKAALLEADLLHAHAAGLTAGLLGVWHAAPPCAMQPLLWPTARCSSHHLGGQVGRSFTFRSPTFLHSRWQLARLAQAPAACASTFMTPPCCHPGAASSP